MIKLAHICCPLRVVIGYIPTNQRISGDIQQLEYTSYALKQLKCKDSLKSGEFMIILGNSSTQGKKEYFFNYKAYVLNTETLDFESLESK